MLLDLLTPTLLLVPLAFLPGRRRDRHDGVGPDTDAAVGDLDGSASLGEQAA